MGFQFWMLNDKNIYYIKMDTLTEENLSEVRDMFKRVDKNDDGVISFDELRTVLETIFKHLPSHRIDKMVTDADKDKDGQISYEEFYRVLKRKSKKNKLLKAFKTFDTNGDGKISLEELMEVLKHTGGELPEQQLKEMIKEVDKDGDGYLNYTEFLNVMVQ